MKWAAGHNLTARQITALFVIQLLSTAVVALPSAPQLHVAGKHTRRFTFLMGSLIERLFTAHPRSCARDLANRHFELPALYIPLAAAASASAAAAIVDLQKRCWVNAAKWMLATVAMALVAILEWLASRCEDSFLKCLAIHLQ
jgi:hypothetical protein